MMDIVAMVPAFVLGCMLVRLAGRVGWVLTIPLGIGTGMGVSSAIFFLLMWAGAASRGSVLLVEAVLMVIGAALWRRAKQPVDPVPAMAKQSWVWALRIAVLLGLTFAATDFTQSIAANPDGGYDAAAIWNVRARYLAGGSPSWRYAVSDKTGTNHPGYPLLTSGFVARTWIVLGDLRSSTPAAVSAIFTLGAFAVLTASVWTLAGEALGWLALLTLVATEGFVSQAPVQYADVPLSFYILASVALLAIGERCEWSAGMMTLAGIAAGMAGWTKNEGLVFVALVFLVALWRGGVRPAAWLAAGAAPMVILTLAFKFSLVDGNEAMFPATAGQAFKMAGDFSRWSEIIASFARNFWELGFPWAHPFVLMAVLAWTFRFAPDSRSRLWLLAAPAGLLAADFAIYLITMNSLTWHLSTSNNRVMVQVWPALLFAFFVTLRAPAETAVDSSKKRRKN